jgi:hypothetical protein
VPRCAVLCLGAMVVDRRITHNRDDESPNPLPLSAVLDMTDVLVCSTSLRSPAIISYLTLTATATADATAVATNNENHSSHHDILKDNIRTEQNR